MANNANSNTNTNDMSKVMDLIKDLQDKLDTAINDSTNTNDVNVTSSPTTDHLGIVRFLLDLELACVELSTINTSTISLPLAQSISTYVRARLGLLPGNNAFVDPFAN